jgi:light-regulated signal transduction histidine kinase (bacteriophytochrome)
VPLHGRDAAPPDLTWSDLRSVSPVHRVYLANMGVTGSLSFPVVVGNALVALIAAHHAEPLPLPHSLLEQLAERVRGFSFALAALRAQSRMRMIDNLVRRFSALRLVLHRHGDLVSAWPEVGPLLQHEFRVDGAMLCLDDCLAASGQGFEPPALAAFDDWFCREQRDLVWVGDHLRGQVPDFPLSEIAGVLALRVHAADGDGLRLYLTRCEHIHEVAWGGNPDKPVDHHDGVLGIAPRRSFEKWVEKRVGYSRPWENEARLLALKLRELLQPASRPSPDSVPGG